MKKNNNRKDGRSIASWNWHFLAGETLPLTALRLAANRSVGEQIVSWPFTSLYPLTEKGRRQENKPKKRRLGWPLIILSFQGSFFRSALYWFFFFRL